MQRIYLLTTGGTIEKVYSEQSGTVENRAAKLDRCYLRKRFGCLTAKSDPFN